MKNIVLIILLLGYRIGFSQTKPGTTFNGNAVKDPEVCAASAGNFVSEKQVDDMITEMLGKIGTRNRYIIVNCTQVENCQAFLFKGRPYILYNPNFLGRVKKLNFSEASLPDATDKDWETLTILAHELGHHVNNHLLNPLPDATQRDMELEADETAGFIIYLLGGTLTQAKIAFNNTPEKGSYTHPGRQQRLDAVTKGWNDAKNKYPRTKVIPELDPKTIKDKDLNTYKTVRIGQQLWLQSNLNVSRFSDGTTIPEAKTSEEWKNANDNKKPAWCYYDNDPANGKIHGKLYNWYAVADPRGLAPEGWHIPVYTELDDLIDFLGDIDMVGGKMKSLTGWKYSGGGTNESGFSGLPGGNRESSGQFQDIGEWGYWWPRDYNPESSRWWILCLRYKDSKLVKNGKFGGCGFYVRCIKD